MSANSTTSPSGRNPVDMFETAFLMRYANDPEAGLREALCRKEQDPLLFQTRCATERVRMERHDHLFCDDCMSMGANGPIKRFHNLGIFVLGYRPVSGEWSENPTNPGSCGQVRLAAAQPSDEIR